MSNEWLNCRLSDVVTLQRGFDLPEQDRSDGPVPILGSFGVTGSHSLAKVAGPGVTVGRSGASIGVATYTEQDYWPLNTTLYVRDFHGNNPRFIYFLLKSINFTAYNSGSAQPSLNRNYISHLAVLLPPMSQQRAIAFILGALDDKIGANQRACLKLDALVRAEVENAQTGATALVSLGDLVERVNNIAKPEEFQPSTVYVGLEHIPRGLLFLTESGRSESLASAKAKFEAGDILFGKLRPYFKKVSIAPCAGVCSTDVLVLRPRRPEQSALSTVVCASDEVINYASEGSHGTRMPRVSWEYLSAWKVAVPSPDVIRALEQSLAPMLRLGIHLTYESKSLEELRDAILSKLLSGELRVRDAEALVEESV